MPTTDRVSDGGAARLRTLGKATLRALKCLTRMGGSDRSTFRVNGPHPAITADLVEPALARKVRALRMKSSGTLDAQAAADDAKSLGEIVKEEEGKSE